ncbi:hypothetical protein HDU78_000491 [Chytriomyces hyalinus]|nr:hypothetical protein HDU78_000491 [Chytriomyces hyalinus]
MGRRSKDVKYHNSILAPFAVYTGIHLVTARVLRMSGVPEDHVLMLAEKVPSTISAVYTATQAMKLFGIIGAADEKEADRSNQDNINSRDNLENKDLNQQKRKQFHWQQGWDQPQYSDEIDRVFARHIGYTTYDLLVMMNKSHHPSAWVHHIFALFGTSAMRVFKQGAYFPTCFLPAEATVAITNVLYVVQKYYPGSHNLITLLLAIRCVMFTVFRFAAAPLCVTHALRNVKVLGADGKPRTNLTLMERIRAFSDKYFRTLHPVVSVGTCMNVAIFTGLNTWWTLLTYRALWKHIKQGRAKLNIHHI